MAEIKNYPSNSLKSREKVEEKNEKPKVEPVINEGSAKVMQPSTGRKIFNAFFPEATNKSIGAFFLYDLCIPTIRNFIGTVMISGGKNISKGLNGDIFGSGKSSYDKFYNGGGGKVFYINSKQQRSKFYDCEHVWYASLAEAQKVIEKMEMVLESYPYVLVADMKEFSHIEEEINPGDQHIGWRSMEGVKWYSNRGGYTVVYPPTIEVNER